MKKIEIILKVTDACNLRCKYCYNSEKKYTESCLSPERFEKLLNVLLTGYNLIHIIWHGGEPLCAGLDYFKQAMDIERRVHIQSGVVIENSIQTNGTLIDGAWIKFFKENDIRVGISFDGVENGKYRQGTEKTLAAMEKLTRAGVKFGCNAVVADGEYSLKDNYKFFASRGIGFDFSPVLSEGGAKDMPSLECEKYARDMCELFDEWIYDKEGVSVRTFALYLNIAAGGRYRICSCCSCHMKYLSVYPDGGVYNCGRESMGKYPFGNIDSFGSVKEIFNSEGALELIGGSVKRREACRVMCEYFSVCQGGCADIAITEGCLEEAPANYCHIFKTVYGHVKRTFDSLMEKGTPLSELNPAVKSVLAGTLTRTDSTTKTEIADTYI